VDDLGRFVLVEVKNEAAGLDALAQLLSYAEHCRIAPLGEMEAGFATIARRGGCAAVLQHALGELVAWAGHTSRAAARAVRPRTAGWQAWPAQSGPSLASFARATWGDHALTVSGAQARTVLVAPSFDDVVSFAESLNSRRAQVELIRADLWRSRAAGIGLTWAPVVTPNPAVEPVWSLAARLWRVPTIREHFAVNAWADSLNGESFSFSARRAPEARFWIGGDSTTAELFTTVPDNWHTGTAQRRRLRDRFLAALPSGHDGGRWLEWEFAIPREAKRFEACASHVADAVSQVLVPARPAF
jgi:hypothetical protein